MLNFLKNIKNFAVISISNNLGWLVDNRKLIANVGKVVVLTPPALQRELKKQYRGADVYFKYIDEMKEASQFCDCAMFININKDFITEYINWARKNGVLKYIVVPTDYDCNSLKINSVMVNGCDYIVYDINTAAPVIIMSTPILKEEIKPIPAEVTKEEIKIEEIKEVIVQEELKETKIGQKTSRRGRK